MMQETAKGKAVAAATVESAVDVRLDSKVAVFKLIPGFDPVLLETVVDLGYHGVVLEAYGCGGITNYRRNLLPAIEKMIHKGMLTGQSDPAGHKSIIDHRRLSVEGKAGVRFLMADAVESPHKIQMPGSAAELAVSNNMVSGRFLLRHQFGNALILHSFELIGGNGSCFIIGAGLFSVLPDEESCPRSRNGTVRINYSYQMSPLHSFLIFFAAWTIFFKLATVSVSPLVFNPQSGLTHK